MASCCLCSGSITAERLRNQDAKLVTQKGSRELSCRWSENATPGIVEMRCAAGCRRLFHSWCFEKALVNQKYPHKDEYEARSDEQSEKLKLTDAAWENRQFWNSLRCFPHASCHANVYSVCLFSITHARSDTTVSNVKVSATLAIFAPSSPFNPCQLRATLTHKLRWCESGSCIPTVPFRTARVDRGCPQSWLAGCDGRDGRCSVATRQPPMLSSVCANPNANAGAI